MNRNHPTAIKRRIAGYKKELAMYEKMTDYSEQQKCIDSLNRTISMLEGKLK